MNRSASGESTDLSLKSVGSTIETVLAAGRNCKRVELLMPRRRFLNDILKD